MSAAANTNHLGFTLTEKFLCLTKRLLESNEKNKELTVTLDLMAIFKELSHFFSRGAESIITARDWMLVDQIVTSKLLDIPHRKKICATITDIFGQEDVVKGEEEPEFNRNKIIRDVFLGYALKKDVKPSTPAISQSQPLPTASVAPDVLKREVSGIDSSIFLAHGLRDPVALNQFSVYLCKLHEDPAMGVVYWNAINGLEDCEEKLTLLCIFTFVFIARKEWDLFGSSVKLFASLCSDSECRYNLCDNLISLFMKCNRIDLARLALDRMDIVGVDEIKSLMELKSSLQPDMEKLKKSVLDGSTPISSPQSGIYQAFLLDVENLVHSGKIEDAQWLLYGISENLDVDHSPYLGKTLPLFFKVGVAVISSNFDEIVAIANSPDSFPRKDFLLSHCAKIMAKEGADSKRGLEIAKKIADLDIRLRTLLEIGENLAKPIAVLDQHKKVDSEVSVFFAQYEPLFNSEKVRLEIKYNDLKETLSRLRNLVAVANNFTSFRRLYKKIRCDLQNDRDLLQQRLESWEPCSDFFKVGAATCISLPTQWPVFAPNPFGNKPLTVLNQGEYLRLWMFYQEFTSYIIEATLPKVNGLTTMVIQASESLTEFERRARPKTFFKELSVPINPVKCDYNAHSMDYIGQYLDLVFQDTLTACVNGYISSHGAYREIVKLEPLKMLKETMSYEGIPPLPAPSKTYSTQFSVMDADTLDVLVQRRAEGEDPVGINMANRFHPGGGVEEACHGQEETICRRSNYLLGLKTQAYPFPKNGGIYSPHVSIFREDQSQRYQFMNKPIEVALVAVAAYDLREEGSDRAELKLPALRELSADLLEECKEYQENTKIRIRQMLRIMASKGHTQLVLGALGCGAFQNPPQLMATLFGQVFSETEFVGRFEQVDFAILKVHQKDELTIEAFKIVCQQLTTSQIV